MRVCALFVAVAVAWLGRRRRHSAIYPYGPPGIACGGDSAWDRREDGWGLHSGLWRSARDEIINSSTDSFERTRARAEELSRCLSEHDVVVSSFDDASL